jgi:hypothetical protein
MTTFQKGYTKRVKYGSTSSTYRTKTVLADYVPKESTSQYLEQTQPEEFWNAHSDSTINQELTEKQQQELDDTKEELIKHILTSLPDLLTTRQLQIFLAYLEGTKTQEQIAKEIGISARAAISYSLHGQPQNDKQVRIGGSIPALQHWAANDDTCKRLIVKINKIVNGEDTYE